MRRHELVTTYHFFRWLAYEYPRLYDVAFHIPNEGKRNPQTGRMMCLKAGVPDICIAYPSGRYHGIFIEMKVKPNKCTEKQLLMIERLQNNGYKVHVCYSLDEAMDAVKDYLKEDK